MNAFTKDLRASLAATLLLALFCGAYALMVWAPAQILWPAKANGSLIQNEDTILGSRLIGQGFSGEKYFHPRPSSAGNGYDAQNSGGSNLGPTSQKLIDGVKANVDAYRKDNGLSATAEVPADAVTGSASGLDPHISPDNALLQAPRVAKARGMDVEKLKTMIMDHTAFSDFGLMGNPGVNVLELNLDLDGKLK
jgi:K+-transporting ATPase ATPase C chain